jgi:hypothetical protein
MRKSHSFDDLSDRKCIEPNCPKFIKKRLVQDIDARRCNKHHKAFKKRKHKTPTN